MWKQENRPLLSVIIPAYNVRDYVEECVRSVLAQDYAPMEVLVVDDCSTDGTAALLHACFGENEQVRLLSTVQNSGVSAARNLGITQAQGEVIAFVDGDDSLAKGTYGVNMALLLAQPQIDLLQFPAHYFYNHEPLARYEGMRTGMLMDGQQRYKALMKEQITCTVWNKLYRTELLRDIRFVEGVRFEDFHFVADVVARCQGFYFSDQGMYLYRYLSSSYMHQHIDARKALDYLSARLRIAEGASAYPALSLRVCRLLLDNYRGKEIAHYADFSEVEQLRLQQLLEEHKPALGMALANFLLGKIGLKRFRLVLKLHRHGCHTVLQALQPGD